MKIAELCTQLNVDAVACIELDLGYKPGMFSGMSGTGIFAGIVAPATPSVSSAMVMISKDGKVVAQTGPVIKGAGQRYKGKSAAMLKRGKVTLQEKDAAAVVEFTKAIQLSAEGLRMKIQKEFGAK